MGFWKKVGGFVKNKVWNQYIKPFPQRVYNNIRDNWHYTNRLPGSGWTATIVRGGFILGGIWAGVSASIVTSGHSSVIATAGCVWHYSTKGYDTRTLCMTEACRRMNPPVCQQAFADRPPPPSSNNRGQPAPTHTPRPKASKTPTKTPIPYDRCDLFEEIDISYYFMDMKNCNPRLTIGFKFPGGVPGLEPEGPTDGDGFIYKAKLGNVLSDSCQYLDYENQLFCDLTIPSGYANSLRTLELFESSCEDAENILKPIFVDERASVPEIEGCRQKSGSSQGDSQTVACEMAATEAECLAAGGSAISQNGVYTSCYCTDY